MRGIKEKVQSHILPESEEFRTESEDFGGRYHR